MEEARAAMAAIVVVIIHFQSTRLRKSGFCDMYNFPTSVSLAISTLPLSSSWQMARWLLFNSCAPSLNTANGIAFGQVHCPLFKRRKTNFASLDSLIRLVLSIVAVSFACKVTLFITENRQKECASFQILIAHPHVDGYQIISRTGLHALCYSLCFASSVPSSGFPMPCIRHRSPN